MTAKDQEIKSEILAADSLFSRLKMLAYVGVATAVLVLGVYAFNFYANELSRKPDGWGQFGDYVGGITESYV